MNGDMCSTSHSPEKWTRLKAMLKGQRIYLKDNILVRTVNTILTKWYLLTGISHIRLKITHIIALLRPFWRPLV